MAKGTVYILTNPCLDGWVKIGMTDRNDVQKRLDELNRPANMPLSFRCYATYEVENALEVEHHIHNLIDMVDDSLHAREELANGKIRQREFFRISKEAAYGIFKNVAGLRGDSQNLKLYEPTIEETQEEEIAEKTSKTRTTFERLEIPIGATLTFFDDDDVVCKVIDKKNKVEFENSTFSMSELASKLLTERNGWKENASVNGWRYFRHNGVILTDLRNELTEE